MKVLFILLLLGFSVSQTCNQNNKQKARYAQFTYDPPLAATNALAVEFDVIWDNVEGAQSYGKNGNFQALSGLAFGDRNLQVPGGYAGPQSKGGIGANGKDQILFSLWDANPNTTSWNPALPAHPNCYRNCQDCAVKPHKKTAPDGSTGTQCKLLYPKAFNSEHMRFTLQRVERDITNSDHYNRSFTGDVWEFAVQFLNSSGSTNEKIVVGRQLLSGLSGASVGLRSFGTFNEFLGCTECGSYTQQTTVRGPWVTKPATTKLVKVASQYSNKYPEFTCRNHSVEGSISTGIVFQSGPGVFSPGDGTWSKTLYECNPSSTAVPNFCQPPSASVTTPTPITPTASGTAPSMAVAPPKAPTASGTAPSIAVAPTMSEMETGSALGVINTYPAMCFLFSWLCLNLL